MSVIYVLDIDGTLVDSTFHHVLAWHRAFLRFGLNVPTWKIQLANGMGGDNLVPALAGSTVDEKLGDEIRAGWEEEFTPFLDEVEAFEGAHRLLAAMAIKGTVVLASSAKPEQVKRYLDLLNAHELADGWTSSGDVSRTKPCPDLIEAGLATVDRPTNPDARAVVIGDSRWDCEAATRAGLPSVGVRGGGFHPADLRDAGASAVYASLDELRADLDDLPTAPIAP